MQFPWIHGCKRQIEWEQEEWNWMLQVIDHPGKKGVKGREKRQGVAGMEVESREAFCFTLVCF